jgi:hypothetical protein
MQLSCLAIPWQSWSVYKKGKGEEIVCASMWVLGVWGKVSETGKLEALAFVDSIACHYFH